MIDQSIVTPQPDGVVGRNVFGRGGDTTLDCERCSPSKIAVPFDLLLKYGIERPGHQILDGRGAALLALPIDPELLGLRHG